MGFVANFVRFQQQCKNFENLLRFDKIIDSLKVVTFLRHRVYKHGVSKKLPPLNCL